VDGAMSRKHERLTPKQRRERDAYKARFASLGWCAALGQPGHVNAHKIKREARIARMDEALERACAVSREQEPRACAVSRENQTP
jgi:hypothetical protein